MSFISIHGDSEDGYASLDSFQVLEDDPERVCEVIPSLAEIIECEAGQFECPDDHSCINEVCEPVSHYSIWNQNVTTSKFHKANSYLGCSQFLRRPQKRFNVKSNP